MEDFKKIIDFNQSQQNDLMAWYCLKNSEIGRLKQLLKDGMPLTAFILTGMVFFGYSRDAVREVLKTGNNIDGNVIAWMQHYFKVSELTEIIPLYTKYLPSDYPSDEECIEMKLWNTLYERGKYDLVAQYSPQILQDSGKVEGFVALLNADFEKYAPFVMEQKRSGLLIYCKDGWKYLVDHGRAGFVLQMKDASGLLDEKAVQEYCLSKGLTEELYKAKCYEILLEHQEFDVFVKHHHFAGKILLNYPDKMDWEDLWNTHNDEFNRRYLINWAVKRRSVSKCRDFLKQHAGIWTKLRYGIF